MNTFSCETYLIINTFSCETYLLLVTLRIELLQSIILFYDFILFIKKHYDNNFNKIIINKQ
jgi:hypothetical protein